MIKTKNKLLLITTPFSKLTTVPGTYSQVLDELTKRFAVDVHTTAYPGDSFETARKLSGDYDVICACGGDGTLNEVVRGVYLSGANTPIGVIPCGTGNIFAASSGISRVPSEAARALVKGFDNPQKFDLGRMGENYFVFVASFGYFTQAVNVTPRESKHALGSLAYVLEGIKDIRTLKAYDLSFNADGVTHSGSYIFGSVTNSTQVCGLMQLDPKVVSFGDGMFEVILIKMPQNLSDLAQCVKQLSTMQYDRRNIDFFKASSITVTRADSTPWSLDGDPANFEGIARIENIPRAISIIR